MPPTQWYIAIIDRKTGEEEDHIGNYSSHSAAEYALRGVRRQLDSSYLATIKKVSS